MPFSEGGKWRPVPLPENLSLDEEVFVVRFTCEVSMCILTNWCHHGHLDYNGINIINILWLVYYKLTCVCTILKHGRLVMDAVTEHHSMMPCLGGSLM